ncbi:MAG: magnesium/cobalt transporter CorA [Acidobacteriota bacterium]
MSRKNGLLPFKRKKKNSASSLSRALRNRSTKIGQSPGTVVFVGEKKTKEVKISYMDYHPDHLEEKAGCSIEDCLSLSSHPSVSWINVSGVHDVTVIEEIGKAFELHPLILEEIVFTEQRPKFEDFGDYLFVVVKMLSYNQEKKSIEGEQISLILKDSCVISFQEREGDIFDFVRERIRGNKGRIRKMGADYLLYVLLDAVVDHYFLILEKYGDLIEDLDDAIVESPNPNILQIVHSIKRDVLYMRRSAWPLREVLNGVLRSESPLLKKMTDMFLRDVYDHTIQVMETVDTFRDMLAGIHDTYLSSISNRMNEVMKVLTIIATIFIPLTFIAGIYGMNFAFMPELKWKGGYFMVWGVIIIVSLSMLWFFKRKKWL